MSDPLFHFMSGALVGGIVGTEISDRVGGRVNPMILFLGAGAASVAVDLGHLTRLRDADWSYARLILEAEKYPETYNYHGVVFWLITLFTIGTFIYWQSAKANELRSTALKAGWVFCYSATLTTAVAIHLFMDYVFQCTIWPAVRCGWVGG